MEKSREVDMVRLSLLSEPRRRIVNFEDQKMQKAEAEQNSQPQTHRPISDRIMARVYVWIDNSSISTIFELTVDAGLKILV